MNDNKQNTVWETPKVITIGVDNTQVANNIGFPLNEGAHTPESSHGS